ncbi:MAG: glycosyl hydrolase 115 family protein, partial [Bacteroidetes bacterium]|nr:glycosyl hydrolase 115 family protein [Bacteroidota bacterium]
MITSNRIVPLYIAIVVIFVQSLYALPFQEQYVLSEKTPQAFPLVENGKAAPFYVSDGESPGILRVAKHFQDDIRLVTNVQPEVFVGNRPTGKEIVIIGTIEKSKYIQQLVKERKIDVTDLRGKWETFQIQIVENPLKGVERALVIVGSDKRGAMYGIFDISEQMGVSPWYWWADVPPKKKENVYVKNGVFTCGTPKVKYRGIFINDEAPALTDWVNEKYGGFNHNFYVRVFELIIRLKGNFLWPAMWGKAFYDDDSLNAPLADEYGVVISTSHHEPMMRAQDEWRRYGSGPWNYEKNEDKLREFWRKGIERMNHYESIVTIGMRGDGDEPMSDETNIALLERIVRDQRQILSEVTGKEASEIPQVWALYKEVQDYYDKGMRVPDDVTLLLCDDNWGNIRKLPDPNEKPRMGGYGIYYHYDYVGGPRNYKWLNTNQIERVWEQMHLAYEFGARQIWIVNVGDIKPMEFPISFFLDYAWNPEKISHNQLQAYTKDWSSKQFGEIFTNEIAECIELYTKYNSRRKPELLFYDTYSLVNYREFELVVADYKRLENRARAIGNNLPAEYQDAFY